MIQRALTNLAVQPGCSAVASQQQATMIKRPLSDLSLTTICKRQQYLGGQGVGVSGLLAHGSQHAQLCHAMLQLYRPSQCQAPWLS